MAVGLLVVPGTGAVAEQRPWYAVLLPSSDAPVYEASVGVDGAADSWSAYANLGAAITGDIRSNGWRLRSGATVGRYVYSRKYFDAATFRFVYPEFNAHVTTADLLVGYHHQLGALVLKAFAGGVWENVSSTARMPVVLAADVDHPTLGSRMGLKLAVETWYSFGNWGYLQLDGSWTSISLKLNARGRGGYRLTPGLSIGPEVAAFGNDDHISGRLGAFARYEWTGGEVSVSAGVAGDGDAVSGPYGSLGVSLRF